MLKRDDVGSGSDRWRIKNTGLHGKAVPPICGIVHPA